jgi:hypothetical protein
VRAHTVVPTVNLIDRGNTFRIRRYNQLANKVG